MSQGAEVTIQASCSSRLQRDLCEGTMGQKFTERVQGQISAARTYQPKEFASDWINKKKPLVLHKGF